MDADRAPHHHENASKGGYTQKAQYPLIREYGVWGLGNIGFRACGLGFKAQYAVIREYALHDIRMPTTA